MNLNIKSELIHTKNYITSDGMHFENYSDAEYHEKYCMYKRYESEYDETLIPILKGSIIKIKNYERLQLLKFYYEEVQNCWWKENANFKKIKYPCYIIYEDYGNIYCINNILGIELYKWYEENKDIIENKKV